MKRFNCPICNKELVRIEPFEKGIYKFWCDDCNVDIVITKNNETEDKELFHKAANMNKYVYYSQGANYDNTDDVAITEAIYLDDAIENFKKYYTNASEENVRIIDCRGIGCSKNIMFVNDY